MNDLLDLVGELARAVPPLRPERVDRQRSALMDAVRAEHAAGEGGRSPRGRRARNSLLGKVHQRPALFVGGIAASIAVMLLICFVVLPGIAKPPSAAAAVLEQAASAAGQFTTPGPGQYLYTETQTAYEVAAYVPGSIPGQLTRVATVTFGVTDQGWTDAAGNGQVLLTEGTLQFPSPADQTAWNASFAGGSGLSSQFTDGPGGGQLQSQTPQLDVSDLPTDPSQLATVLARGQLGTAQYIPNGADAAFERAARLLLVPTSGMTATLTSALFQVMADQPGVRFLGTVTDRDGQQGQGVVLGNPGTTTRVNEVIVDPERGQLLEVDYAPPGASRTLPNVCTTIGGNRTCRPPKGAASLGPLWTDVVARGVVGSTTATVSATGSVTVTATQVPGAPTDLVATVQNGAVDLTWDPPAAMGAGPVTDYEVYLGTTGSPKTGPMNTQSAATTYSWPLLLLPSGKPMTFAVQAVNADGYGPQSSSVRIMP